jgi:hypothetical protein
MLLVVCKNIGLINTLINYYAYEVKNKLILFVDKITDNSDLTLDFYQDFNEIINDIDNLYYKSKLKSKSEV